MVNVILGQTSFIVCPYSSSGKGKAENSFNQCEYE